MLELLLFINLITFYGSYFNLFEGKEVVCKQNELFSVLLKLCLEIN